MESRPTEFDGLVVEGPSGVRLVAIPAALLPVLRDARVIQYSLDGNVSRMVVDPRARFAAPRQPEPQSPPPSPGSAPTPEYGAPTLPILGAGRPSPTPPPAPEEPEDPSDIPIRVRRNGQWTTVHITRKQYEEYQREGRLSQDAPADYQGDESQ